MFHKPSSDILGYPHDLGPPHVVFIENRINQRVASAVDIKSRNGCFFPHFRSGRTGKSHKKVINATNWGIELRWLLEIKQHSAPNGCAISVTISIHWSPFWAIFVLSFCVHPAMGCTINASEKQSQGKLLPYLRLGGMDWIIQA